jgi:hypothetical protein
MSDKQYIKDQVIGKLDEFSKDLFESIRITRFEGDIPSDPKLYMSIDNVRKVLNECFEKTYENTKNDRTSRNG